jgi:glycosyltransferase involved in cell wall biosynthesis
MTAGVPGPRPFFSIVVTSFNRAAIVSQCVESCLRQTYPDFELVVVDDGSTDDTVAVLTRDFGDSLTLVRHERNRGINPARHSGVAAARGEWIVVVDSDWELLPTTLARLAEIVAGAPAGVRAVRSRLRWDDGHVTPAIVPASVVDYVGRIRWLEQLSDTDAGRCFHRTVFESSPYIADRRGAMETLWELNLARHTLSICVDEVLGLEHAPPDSYLRSRRRSDLIPRLIAEAPDMLWMAETALREHGAALEAHGPRQHRTLLRVAAQQAFLVGHRRRGLRHAGRAMRHQIDLTAWVSVVLGLIGARPLAYGMLAYRLRTAR